jgi:hypothetical protein
LHKIKSNIAEKASENFNKKMQEIVSISGLSAQNCSRFGVFNPFKNIIKEIEVHQKF